MDTMVCIYNGSVITLILSSDHCVIELCSFPPNSTSTSVEERDADGFMDYNVSTSSILF